MKYRIFAAVALLAFALSAVGGVLAEKSSSNANELAALLPESDGVITLDSARLFNELLPQVLSVNPATLLKVNAKLDEIADETGLDLRKFKEVTVGLKIKKVSKEQTDFEPVLLARGNVEPTSLDAVAKLASDDKYRTEKIGNRTVYIFSSAKLIEKNKPSAKPDDQSMLDKTMDKVLKGLSTEIALTAYDENTVVLGTLARVKETIGNSPRVKSDVLALLERKPNAVAKMGANLPEGISDFVSLGDDELGANLRSIKQLQGSLDINDGNAIISVMAKTLEVQNAQDLEATLVGLKGLGAVFLGNSKRADQQVYARMLKNVEISREAQSIMIDLNVPKSDIDTLLSKK